MKQSQFCPHCSKIYFHSLRAPSPVEINTLLSGESSGGLVGGPRSASDIEKVALGTLARIRRDSSTCALCDIFYHIVSRQGSVFQLDRSLDAENIFFRADPDLSYYGFITDARADGGSHWIVRRLSLTAHLVEDPELPVAYFDHVLQPCDIEDGLSASIGPHDDGEGVERGGMWFGGRRRPQLVEMEWLRGWMRICEEQHGPNCSLTPSQEKHAQMDYIRFIDVKEKCIRKFVNVNSSSIKFAALSYVWGSAEVSQPVKLENANISTFESPLSLTKVQLPQTITDALGLCSKLCIDYLWVDALCIIQDNIDDQKYQIGRMADIYAFAFLTIADASGAHSNSGLPGLRPGTRSYEQKSIVVVPHTDESAGLSLMTTVKSHPQHWNEFYSRGLEDIDHSKWNSRAWTMQERALSRRNLILTKEQVLWSCQQAYFCEESHFEVPHTRFRPFNSTTAHGLGIRDALTANKFWGYYQYLVDQYTRRDMTYDGDVFDAFQAVADGLERTSGERFLWGLPLSRFDLAVSWDTFHGQRRRTALSKLPMTSLNTRTVFPSWSWMGWIGQAHCWVSDDRLECEKADIICYTHRSHPLQFFPVKVINSVEPRHKDIDVDSSAHISETDLAKHLPSLTSTKLASFPDEYLLFFWTSSAFFNVPQQQTSNGAPKSFTDYSKDPRPVVRDASGEAVGSVCKMAPENQELSEESSCLREFVIVGRRAIPEIPDCPQTILALQVEWKGGVAYRVNIAEIQEGAWVAASPKRSLIALG